MFEAMAAITGLSVFAIIGATVAMVRDWQEKASRREFNRQRRIARAQRLAMAQRRRAREITREHDAHKALAAMIKVEEY